MYEDFGCKFGIGYVVGVVEEGWFGVVGCGLVEVGVYEV